MSKASSQTSTAKSAGVTRSTATLLQSQNTLGEHVCVQREATDSTIHPAAPSMVREMVKSPGRQLDSRTRSDMESSLGHDFSQVRVHTDERAAQSAHAVGANAYTAGSHVAFGAGRYAPGTAGGQKLLAHELTHVVQQASGPVAGTEVGEGLSVSEPSDAFERQARQSSGFGLPSQMAPAVPAMPSIEAKTAHSGLLSIQRDTATPLVDSSGTGPFTAKETKAAETSATAAKVGIFTGAASALGSLVSAFEAVRQANFAERSAEAAEDPPIPEPVSGGVTSNHTEFVEAKGIKVAEPKPSEPPAGGGKKQAAKAKPADEPDKAGDADKEADKPDQERQFKVLRLTEGHDKDQKNSAEFVATLRYNGTDVRGGATEDGDIEGYLGGTNNSNAAVTFKASPGRHLDNGTATERLLFGGTNVPARKKLGSGTGFLGLGKGGTETNKNYKVQRFSGSARFSGAGNNLGVETVHATPTGQDSVVTKGNGDTTPMVTISLNPAAAAAPSLPGEKGDFELPRGFPEKQFA